MDQADLSTTIRAALAKAGAGAAVSHETAAIVRTLWLPRRPSSLIHLTRGGAIERTHQGVRLHGSRLPEEFVEDLDGMPVTTVARTAVDVARGLTLPDAMTVIDSAARLLIQQASGEDLRVLRSVSRRAELLPLALAPLNEAFASVWTWPGTVVVRGAIELVDPASESPHESRSRGWMYEAKLPMPRTAYEVQGASGAWYASEFGWEKERVLGEVDGIEKYGRTGDEVTAAVRAERLRQADLQDAGWALARWTPSERRAVVIRRIARTLGL
ncbi:hypothetical protein [Longivirga aurantiaca]|uniref:Transcriptional regulator, AbiEi antitoxin, Type IV TA system n=1 Tax=Longivirga aurantiaca TaxID=1837743 RepID=A0ABW1SYB5_9ACTN